MSTTQISLRLPDDLLAQMERLSDHQAFPPSRTQVIQDAIRAFLEDPAPPYRRVPRRKKKAGAR